MDKLTGPRAEAREATIRREWGKKGKESKRVRETKMSGLNRASAGKGSPGPGLESSSLRAEYAR